MEGVGELMTRRNPTPHFWQGKRVLVTGHTGFKGAYLSLWLGKLGATVTGYSLSAPTEPSLHKVISLADLIREKIADICDTTVLHMTMKETNPEIVFHLAAQSLVGQSYQDPLETYRANVLGTASVLEAVRRQSSVRAVVVITTDKCYENNEWLWGYRENDRLGGYDPYSNSKACAELVVDSFRRCFFNLPEQAGLATTRAGNVIGGGDWAVDRLIPDCLRSFSKNEPVVLRNPGAVRPWQYVLEPLCGYLLLAEELYQKKNVWAEAWNFGPDDPDCHTVEDVVAHLAVLWGGAAQYRADTIEYPHEAGILRLDCAKAKTKLGWYPRWHLKKALETTIAWHKAWLKGQNMRKVCLANIEAYEKSEMGEISHD